MSWSDGDVDREVGGVTLVPVSASSSVVSMNTPGCFTAIATCWLNKHGFRLVEKILHYLGWVTIKTSIEKALNIFTETSIWSLFGPMYGVRTRLRPYVKHFFDSTNLVNRR